MAVHNKVHDGWMALHGKVYNIGPYLRSHPGGVGIMEKFLGWMGVCCLIGFIVRLMFKSGELTSDLK